MALDNNYQLLEREMAADDPWRLDANPFERERHAQMLRLSRSGGRITHALEVGCAAGAFTEQLAPHCQRLTVIDVLPRAIDRARRRTKGWGHIEWIVSDVQQFSTAEMFDLIVLAEVLYYLNSIEQMRATIRNLARMLAPGGYLVFGSARDATCHKWGHVAGAETVIAMLKDACLIEVERVQCRGEQSSEDCFLVCFSKAELSSQPK